MRVITTWDDGSKEDVRIAELLFKYKLPGIFFFNNCSVLPPTHMREIAKYFEVGGHTVTHPPDIKLLDDEAIEFEVRMNKKWVENVIGREIEWFCYPRGRYNDRVIDIVKSVGYKYARTTITGKTTKLEKYDPYRVHTTVHVHPDKKEFKGLSFVEYTKKMFDKAKAENGDFHIWGHGWEIHKYRMWEQLEEVLAYAGTKP